MRIGWAAAANESERGEREGESGPKRGGNFLMFFLSSSSCFHPHRRRTLQSHSTARPRSTPAAASLYKNNEKFSFVFRFFHLKILFSSFSLFFSAHGSLLLRLFIFPFSVRPFLCTLFIGSLLCVSSSLKIDFFFYLASYLSIDVLHKFLSPFR